jgi:arylsulfatase A-like enzyme
LNRPPLRFLLRRPVILGLLFLALVTLHIANYVRVDSGELAAAIEPLLERARDIERRARPEYQSHALATLPENGLNGAFYRFDDHLAEAKVVRAPKLEGNEDNPVLYSLEMNDGESSGLIAPNEDVTQRLDGGILHLSDHGGKGYLTNAAPITVRRADIGDIIIRARATRETRLMLGWSKEANPENPFLNRIDMGLEASNEFQTYVIDARDVLRRNLGPDDAVAHVYLQPSVVDDADLDIDYIRFVSKLALYRSAINGIVQEEVGGEFRSAIYMLTDQTLSWSVNIPTSGPKLDLGQALFGDDRPVRFFVTVEEGGRTRIVHDAYIDTAADWQDASIDLQEWAGKSVVVGLHAEAASAKSLALWSNPRIRSAPQNRLNVIVVLEDALRADYLSTYGYERETSPNKTAIMSQLGVVFEHAFSQATKTRPSVPSLMTGLYPTATGVWHFSDVLSDRYLTLAEIMRSQGYLTASFVQNGNAGPYAGLHQGFDILRDERAMGNDTETILGEPVFKWIEKHRDQNFVLYLHTVDPHGPYAPKPPFDDWYLAEQGRGLAVESDPRHELEGMTKPTAEERRARYAGEIRRNDSFIPAFLDKLRELELFEDTLVIFLADHGEYMGEHEIWEHRPPGLMPVIHVPLMMIYPRRFPKSRRVAENVQLIDVVPTILEMAGIDRSGLLLQGDSLVDLIEGRNPDYWRDRLVISEEPTAMIKENPCPCASLIFRNWHLNASTWTWPGGPLVKWFPTPQAIAKLRVFDFHDDPREEGLFLSFLPDLHLRWLHYQAVDDLANIDGSIHARLTADDDAGKRLDPETLEHLRGLGYVN